MPLFIRIKVGRTLANGTSTRLSAHALNKADEAFPFRMSEEKRRTVVPLAVADGHASRLNRNRYTAVDDSTGIRVVVEIAVVHLERKRFQLTFVFHMSTSFGQTNPLARNKFSITYYFFHVNSPKQNRRRRQISFRRSIFSLTLYNFFSAFFINFTIWPSDSTM